MSNKDYYIVKTSYSNYYVEVWHQYPNVDNVYVGGKKKCVALSVYMDEDMPNIDGVGYDEHCNSQSNLQRGHRTRHMVMCALAFINHIYKHTKNIFYLKDTSRIQCNGYDMYLPYFYILHYGSTWYEKHFHAIPAIASEKVIYKDNVKAFKAYMKTKPSAEDIFQYVRSHERKAALATEYNKQTYKNLNEFIRSTKEMDCLVYKDWADKIIEKFFPNLTRMDWNIEAGDQNVTIDVIIKQEEPNDIFIYNGGDMVSNGVP